MLKRVLAAALCLLWLPNAGIAAPAKGKKAAKTKKTAKVDDSEDSGGSNASLRTAKPFGAALLYTPLSDFILSFGAGGTYTLDAKIQLGFDFLMGSESLVGKVEEQEDVTLSKADLSGMAFYAYGRYFFGESFNVKGGLGYRSADISYQIDDKINAGYLAGDVAVSSIIVPVAIGNHWIWDSGLSVGVDWLTYMIALTGSASASTETNLDIESDKIEELNDDMLAIGDDLAHASTFTLALVSIGYSF